jgi:hypothetical protein
VIEVIEEIKVMDDEKIGEVLEECGVVDSFGEVILW